MASHLTLDDEHYSVGLEIKGNHIKEVTKGMITGIAIPVHLGKKRQIWDISIKDEHKQLVYVARLTMIVLEGPPHKGA